MFPDPSAPPDAFVRLCIECLFQVAVKGHIQRQSGSISAAIDVLLAAGLLRTVPRLNKQNQPIQAYGFTPMAEASFPFDHPTQLALISTIQPHIKNT